MAATAQIQYAVTLPANDILFFSELIKRNKWKLTPLTKEKNTKSFSAEQIAIVEMAQNACNKQLQGAPNLSTQEIVQEVRNYRHGK
ncbi:MAG: hypothetical protein LBU90_02570 [Bacteroidales bacterium]|jgi:hypothetical protein|nr:hypothetical protein [Bacteroidales bacterium]